MEFLYEIEQSKKDYKKADKVDVPIDDGVGIGRLKKGNKVVVTHT